MTDFATKFTAWAIYDTLDPTEKPRMVKAVVPIDATGLGVADLNPQNVQINMVQAVYIDNPSATAVISVTHRATGFRIVAPPQTVGWHKISATDNLIFDVASSVTGSPVTMFFTNVPRDTDVTTTTNGSTVAIVSSPAVGMPVLPQASTGQGAVSAFRLLAAATANPALVKGGVCNLQSISVWNTSASPIWLKLFNKATVPVPGTDTPTDNIMCPAGASINFDTGYAGWRNLSGLGMALTGGPADNDATALAQASQAGVSFRYT